MKTRSSSTHKKVIVEAFDGARLRGYINPRTFDKPEGLEFLDAAGQLKLLRWKDVKVAWFVRDWENVPRRPELTTYVRRPRLAGLWVRLHFRDDEVLEGILVNDLLQVSAHGYLVTPPEANGSHQKAFVPRLALKAMEVLAVIPNRGTHRRRRPRRVETVESRQPLLFPE